VLPILDSRTSTASPGFVTHVALTYNSMHMLDAPYRSYGDRYCVKKENIDTVAMKIDQPYFLRACLHKRALMKAESECRCTVPFRSRPTGKQRKSKEDAFAQVFFLVGRGCLGCIISCVSVR
jgi:hypothetical protein